MLVGLHFFANQRKIFSWGSSFSVWWEEGEANGKGGTISVKIR